MLKKLVVIWFTLWSFAAPALYFSNPAKVAAISNSVPTIVADAYIDYSAVGEGVALTLVNLNASSFGLTVVKGTNLLTQKASSPGMNPDGSQLTNLLWGTTTLGPNMGCKVSVGGQIIDATQTRYGCIYNLGVTNSQHTMWFTNNAVYSLAYGQYIKFGGNSQSGDQFVQGYTTPFFGQYGVWAYSEGTGQIRVGVETGGGGQATAYTATGAGQGILLQTNNWYFFSYLIQMGDTNTIPGITNAGTVALDVWSNNIMIGTTNIAVTNYQFIRQMGYTGRNSGEPTHPNYSNFYGPILIRVSTNHGSVLTKFTPYN